MCSHVLVNDILGDCIWPEKPVGDNTTYRDISSRDEKDGLLRAGLHQYLHSFRAYVYTCGTLRFGVQLTINSWGI